MGDLRAFDRIVRHYYKLAFGYALSILGDYHFAEDAVQESFADVYKSLRYLREPSAFPSWMRRIVFKQCDRLTRRKRHHEVSYEDRIEGAYESPESWLERSEQEKDIRALIGKLPPKQRLVTELFYLDGLSQGDISQFLEIDPATIRKRLFDSRKRIKKEMAMSSEQETDSAIRDLFQNRLAPDLLDKLLSNPKLLDLNGEKRDLTVLFADGVDITNKQNRMGIQEFFSYMNEHFEVLSDIIVSNQGLLDKIVGDEFMAVWGTPANPQEHATRACFAAIDMQTELRTRRERYAENPEKHFSIAIGINSGEAIIGNFGPRNIMQYTPMGDTINFGARLERVSRTYGVEIIIGEATYANARDQIIARKLDDIEVRYQTEKVGVYELVARKNPGVSESVRKKLQLFNEGLTAFGAGDIQDARKKFLGALEESGGTDGPSLIYLQRCAGLKV